MIEDIFFTILYLLVLGAGISLYKMACGNLLRPSILMLFFWHYLLFVYSGTILIYFGVFKQFVYFGVVNKELIWMVWVSASTCFIVIPLVYMLLSEVSEGKKLRILSHSVRDLPFPAKKHSNLILFLLFVVCMFVFALYLRKTTTIPFLLVLSGADPNELMLARSAAGNAFAGKYHWYALFFLEILPFLTYVSFVEYLRNRSKLFLFLLPFVLLAGVVSIAKFSLFRILIALIFIRYVVKKSSISLKDGVKYISVCMIILVFIYTLFTGMNITNAGGCDVLIGIIGRLTAGTLTPLYFYYEAFPQYFDFLLGRSFPNPSGILPFEPFRLTVEMMYYVSPGLRETDIVGSMPAVFWGEIYCNFGHIAAFLSMFIVGGIIFIAEKAIRPFAKKSSVGVALYGYIAMHLTLLTQTGLTYLSVDFYLWGVIMTAILLIALSNVFHKSTINRPRFGGSQYVENRIRSNT